MGNNSGRPEAGSERSEVGSEKKMFQKQEVRIPISDVSLHTSDFLNLTNHFLNPPFVSSFPVQRFLIELLLFKNYSDMTSFGQTSTVFIGSGSNLVD